MTDRPREPPRARARPKASADAGAPGKGQRADASAEPSGPGNFIRDVIVGDNASGRYGGRVATRFPPEPNGYLHIGHAKAISVDFGLAREFGGTCNLRYDDTNPTAEDVEYVDAIEQDVRWLGYEWAGVFYASDYFEQLYGIAERLIEKGVAYVDSLDEDQIRDYRGDYYRKGRPSPYRERPVDENLRLFREMRAGTYRDGEHVLRAKIDLESQNMNLRDPILYRIRHARHHRTGDAWCIYPMYDYAHPLSDAIESITHSICTLEFESHRPLYDWCIREAGMFPSQQIEFARLNLTYTVMSKRKLLELVQKGLVQGWDDPRMPTLAGMRRRGLTPEAIRSLCERTGVAKANSVVDVGLLEYCVREDLNRRCPRVMAVLRPLRLVIENFPEGPDADRYRSIAAPLHPEDPSAGTRPVPFSRVLHVERDDFREDPPRDWFRLAPGREVRLRYACLVTCTGVVKDERGEVVELRGRFDPASWGGTSPDGRVVRGTLHWVSAEHSIGAEVRLYDRLFASEFPGTEEGKDFTEELNPGSLSVLEGSRLEPYLAATKPGDRWQFERLGYFAVDPESAPGRLVFNRTVTLKDTWAKIEARGGAGTGPRDKPGAPPHEPRPRRDKREKSAMDTKPGGPPGTDAAGAPGASHAAPGSSQAPPGPAGLAEASAPGSVVAPIAPQIGPEIGIEEFQKLDLRAGVIRAAETVEEAKKLIRLQVDLGEGRLRQVFAGLRAYYPDPSVLVGKRVIVVANLKPRQMRFGVSEGMILAAGGGERAHRVATFDAEDSPLPGDKIA